MSGRGHVVCCLAARKAWVVALANTASLPAGCPTAGETTVEKLDARDLLHLWRWVNNPARDSASPPPTRGLTRARKHRLDPAFARVRDSMADNMRFAQGYKRARVTGRGGEDLAAVQCAAWRAAHPGPPRGAFASWRELPPGLAAAGSDPDLPAGGPSQGAVGLAAECAARRVGVGKPCGGHDARANTERA
jgi:hypothetical protein